MAATGYTPIQLYYSTTASATPSAGNLLNGELAINITDGKMFYKDNSGVVQTIATKANAAITFPLTVTNGGTGQSSYTDGQLLIGNSSGNTLTKATITAGTGISVTNGNGSITIATTGGGGITTGKSIALAMIFGF